MGVLQSISAESTETNMDLGSHFLSTPEESKDHNPILLKNEGVTVRFKCNQCDENFLEIDDLKNHVSSNHQDFSQKTLMNDSYKYVCSQCYLTFTNQNSLISHIESKHDGSIVKNHVSSNHQEFSQK